MTRDDIQAAVNRYVHRTDAATIANELTAITFAQAELSRTFRPRVAFASVDLLPDGAGVALLPADFAAADYVVADTVGELSFLPPRPFASARVSGQANQSFTITGNQLRVYPGLATLCELGYFQLPAALASAGSSNWLTVSYPDVLTYFAIAEQLRFIEDLERAEQMRTQGQALAGEALRQDAIVASSGGAIRMKGR